MHLDLDSNLPTDRLQLTSSGLTGRLDGYVREGRVERRPSTDDRRVMLAVLTESGRRHLDRIAPAHVDSAPARFVDPLDRPESETLGTVFAKVRAALAESTGGKITA
ncbi:MAG: MarR family winged helix-turn-helix transcriptional regulator [Ilumatobacteraceae bacterium]